MITSIAVIISIKTKGDIQCLIKTRKEEEADKNHTKMITSITKIISIKTKGDIQCLIKTLKEEHQGMNRIKNFTHKKIINLCK